jgi:hypothetical protein
MKQTVIYNLKLSWLLDTIKLSQATSHVRWLNTEQTNTLETDDDDTDVLDILVCLPFKHLIWLGA